MTNMPRRQDLLDLAIVFENQGYDFYLVGGCVRDFILHRKGNDIDACTNARPEEIKGIGERSQHVKSVYAVGEKFGTIGFVLRNGQVVEITTYRQDSYAPGSRKPEVRFGIYLQDDLRRRDFTMNAIAYDPLREELVDPYGGEDDMEQGVIRAVGNDPASRFTEDPLRLLRAVRFSGQLGFLIEQATFAVMKSLAHLVTTLSAERIRDELNKMLLCDDPEVMIRLLDEVGLLKYILPELVACQGVMQLPFHSKDVYEHILLVLAGVPRVLELRLAALLHDIAKPLTREVDAQGVTHFKMHEDVGADVARVILNRLRYDGQTISLVCKMVELHMRINGYSSHASDGAVRRLLMAAQVGDITVFPYLIALSRSDKESDNTGDRVEMGQRLDELEARAFALTQAAPVTTLQSPLDGRELMEFFKRPAGPWIREIKSHLQGMVLDGTLDPDDKKKAMTHARMFVAIQAVRDILKEKK